MSQIIFVNTNYINAYKYLFLQPNSLMIVIDEIKYYNCFNLV